MHTKTLVAACLSLCFNWCLAIQAQPMPLAFNGKDTTGWHVDPPNQQSCWTVEEGGILKLENGADKVGSTLWTDKEFGNFVMEFEFKMGTGTVDTGVYVRTEKEQIQIGISGSLKRDLTASPYIAGKGYPVEAEGVKELLKVDDWNEMSIVVKGHNYTVWLNGHHVMTYDSETAIEKGPVGIQLHGSREMNAYYRNIRLVELN